MLIANISPRSMGKTTDTGMMGHAFHEAGYRVQLWDADESEHLTQWSELAGFPFPVKHNASAKFAEEYTPLGEAGIDIVDVGHTENHPHIADSVLKVADLVLIHMEPSMADYQRVHQPRTSTPVKTMVGRSAFDRPSRTAPPMWVLLNRVRPNVRSEKEIRGLLADADYNVLTVKIPVLDDIKQATGFPVEHAARGPFGELVTELQERGLIKSA
ncbi:plasmid partition protein [Streptomyces sparsogenes]|uniref:plasmid partition protein n=1 Tax=Streptomyces TaxID=1883 RepID=UPI00265C4CA8|nr:plasmid partition protein [Streptomyces sp. TG1A-8]MDO0929858.1 plasmid partition protein [Streptomyces sp. TG1A-8]